MITGHDLDNKDLLYYIVIQEVLIVKGVPGNHLSMTIFFV